MTRVTRLSNVSERAKLHFRRIIRPTTTKTIGDRRLNYQTDSVPALKAIDNHEEPNVEWLASRASTDVFWDVGANRGLYSAAVPCQTVSFEPDPRIHAQLNENLWKNDADGVIAPFFLSNSNGWETVEVNQNVGKRPISVRTIRGDALVEAGIYPRPSLMKIDVEGRELDVLEGMADTLTSVDAMVIETHSSELLQKCASHLTDRGFEIEERTLAGREGNTYVRAVKNSSGDRE